jgi:hypothetical protein
MEEGLLLGGFGFEGARHSFLRQVVETWGEPYSGVPPLQHLRFLCKRENEAKIGNITYLYDLPLETNFALPSQQNPLPDQ